jgi:uncharacterized membrane protein
LIAVGREAAEAGSGFDIVIKNRKSESVMIYKKVVKIFDYSRRAAAFRQSKSNGFGLAVTIYLSVQW